MRGHEHFSTFIRIRGDGNQVKIVDSTESTPFMQEVLTDEATKCSLLVKRIQRSGLFLDRDQAGS